MIRISIQVGKILRQFSARDYRYLNRCYKSQYAFLPVRPTAWCLHRCYCKGKSIESGDSPNEFEADISNHPYVRKVLKEIEDDFNAESVIKGATDDDRSQSDDNESEDRIPKHLQEKFVLYRDQDAELILDIAEELQQVDDDEDMMDIHAKPRPRHSLEDINLTRGVSGVFDIGDLVDVLRSENAIDICVIEVPIEICYADYMVIVSGKSPRHLRAISEFINKIYKHKKHEKDLFLKIQGKENKDWIAMDMGNIVLHVMRPDIRKKYDIETLWAVGEKYDRHGEADGEAFVDAIQKHLNYLEEIRPLMNTPKNQPATT